MISDDVTTLGVFLSQMITIKSPGLPHLQGSASYNVMKNRYANINACKLHYIITSIEDVCAIHVMTSCVDDETRVHLSLIPGEEGSDFINANYVEVRTSRETDEYLSLTHSLTHSHTHSLTHPLTD